MVSILLLIVLILLILKDEYNFEYSKIYCDNIASSVM